MNTIPPNIDENIPGLWTVEDVARFLKITIPGIYHMVSRSEIPFTKLGRRVRFVKDDIVNWLNARRMKDVRGN